MAVISRFRCFAPLMVLFFNQVVVSMVRADNSTSKVPDLDLTSYIYDDEQLKKMAHQVDLLTVAVEDLRLQLNLRDLRMEQQFVHIKNALEKSGHESCENELNVSNNLTSSISPPYPTQETSFDQPSKSCAEALHRASIHKGKSGVYQLHFPDSGLKPFYAFCMEDPKGGPAWTVIQRRQDGSQDFYRDWVEYKRGFGNLNTEFFIGLDKIHALTNYRMNELWIHMGDFENETRDAYYESFAIGNEDEKYALNVLGKFSGDAGDSFSDTGGRKFTTKDADNDSWPKNCAVEFVGAWWYGACHVSNLNGQYLKGAYPKDKFAKGINWKIWHGYYYSLKYVHMAIRPKDIPQ